MRSVCAWCKKDLGITPSSGDSENSITHGICDECSYHFMAQSGMELGQFLNGINAPIIVVNSEGNVKSANNKVLMLLKKNLSEVEGFTGGLVFECKYATLPEGCGNTLHCSGCIIRNTVMDTFQSGKSHLKVPAVLNRSSLYDESKKADLLISTEKVGEIVLLRIDEIKNED